MCIRDSIYTEPVEGINVHRYGAHIFHTNNKAVWQYVNQFAEFNRYTNSPVANYHGEIYNLPFNMNTFNKMWGVVTPAEAKAKIEAQRAEAGITEPKNLEEQAISLVGTDIYEKLINDLDGDLSGKDVLIVEDILDTGITLSNLVPMLKMRNPNSVKICTILDKPSRRKADIAPDYEGFAVPDEFVVGYGLDYDEKYRNLPYIGVLKPCVYEK